MNKHMQLFVLAALAVLLSSCGGEQQTAAANQTSMDAVATDTESTEESPTPSEEGLLYAEHEVPLKPMQLSDTRYMKEMVREEIARAYGESGEYIDPRRIVDYLHEQTDAQAPQPEPLANQDVTPAPRSWRISYEVHNEAKALFQQGEYARAAQRWRNLATDRRAFTLSIEVDCDPTVLTSGYAVLQTLEMPIFILPERVGQRDCYRLCAGVFADESAAEKMIDEVKKRIPDSWPFALAFIGSGS